MKLRELADRIEHLLWMGAIEGNQVLRLYHLLQAYQQGKISDWAVQDAIDEYEPEQLDNLLSEKFPPPTN